MKKYHCQDCSFVTTSKTKAVLHTLSKNWYKTLWPVYTNNHQVDESSGDWRDGDKPSGYLKR